MWRKYSVSRSPKNPISCIIDKGVSALQGIFNVFTLRTSADWNHRSRHPQRSPNNSRFSAALQPCSVKFPKNSEIWPKISHQMPKNEKIKNLIHGTLKLTILQPWSKFWVPNIIWGQVISIKSDFSEIAFEIWLNTIENGHFRISWRAIFRQRSKFF